MRSYADNLSSMTLKAIDASYQVLFFWLSIGMELIFWCFVGMNQNPCRILMPDIDRAWECYKKQRNR